MAFNGFNRAKGHTLTMSESPTIWQNGLPLGNGQFGGLLYEPDDSIFEYAFTRLDLWKRHLVGPKRLPLEKFLKLYNTKGVDALMKELDKEFYDTERPCFKTGGFLNLSIDHWGDLGQENTQFVHSMALDIAHGEVKGVYEFSAKSTEWTALVSADEDVTAIHVADGYLHPQCTFDYYQRLELFRRLDEQANVRRKGITKDGILFIEFDFGEELHALTAVLVDGIPTKVAKTDMEASVAVNVILDYTEDELAIQKSSLDHADAVCTKHYEYDIYHTLVVDAEGKIDDLLSIASKRLLAARKRGFATMQAANRRWWKAFWNKSGIAIENAAVEGLWYNNLYQLAATSRGKVMPGLFGLWNGAPVVPWSGDYHGNINVAMYTWPLFGLNHPELQEPLFETLKGWFPAMRRQTKECFGVDELRFPQACGPLGEEMSRGFYRTMRCSTGFYADNYWKQFLYSPDEEKLKNEILPILESGARYYFLYCKQEKDGSFHVGPSWAPEQGVFPAWDTGNDLALFRELFQAVVDANKRLGQWSKTAAKAQNLLDHFPEYPIKNGEFLISGSEKGRTLLCHPSYLACVVPADEIDADSPLADVATHTMRTHHDHTQRKGLAGWKDGYGCDLTAGWLFDCAVKLRDADFAQRMLRDVLIAGHVKSNGMFAFSGGLVVKTLKEKRKAYMVKDTQNHSLLGMSSSKQGRDHSMTMVQIGGGVLYGIMESMLQSQKNEIKLFPVLMPFMGKRLSFHNLVAQGSIEVSAARDAKGVSWFTLKNTSKYAWQGTLRLFDGTKLEGIGDDLGKGKYAISLQPGETLHWWRSTRLDGQEAVPPHKPAIRSYGKNCPITYGE